ncbi:MAG: hypothetical protein ACRD0I_12465 [Acidimicrobiales bacterium]
MAEHDETGDAGDAENGEHGVAGKRKRPTNPARVTQALITRREQLIGYVLAAYAAVGFSLIWIPLLHKTSTHHHSSATVELVVGLGMALILAATARLGRAYFMGAAALLVGLGPWNSASVLGFPAIGLGGWMLYRTSKSAGEARRAARAAGGSTRPAASRRSAGRAGGRNATGSVRGSRRRGSARAGTSATATNRPAASKRYTPPKH